ncbi:hypothetical protein HYDPIDRAFT_104875 [Hydnomerulius pinastri MD-312]|nr:hypothetical protein HYDPIDRAFT_104875 [Hydnomerulius pinastri MD-312]
MYQRNSSCREACPLIAPQNCLPFSLFACNSRPARSQTGLPVAFAEGSSAVTSNTQKKLVISHPKPLSSAQRSKGAGGRPFPQRQTVKLELRNPRPSLSAPTSNLHPFGSFPYVPSHHSRPSATSPSHSRPSPLHQVSRSTKPKPHDRSAHTLHSEVGYTDRGVMANPSQHRLE